MSDDIEEIKRLLYKTLAENTANNFETDKRVSTIELIVKNHMEWEEKNYDDIKDILKIQQSAIERIADKLQTSHEHISMCKDDLKKEIEEQFISKKDLEIILSKHDEEHKNNFRSNRDEINKAKYIIYGIILVFVSVQFLLTNVTKLDNLKTPEPIAYTEIKKDHK